MAIVGAVERTEAHVRGRLYNGFGLAVQPKLAAATVPRSQLLARHGEHAVRAIPHEQRVGTCCDEDPKRISEDREAFAYRRGQG